MHPTRLMIIKLLNSEFSLSSVEIKKVLDIPWGDYTTHTRSLENNGYIKIKEQFSDEGSIKQVLFLTDHAKQEYKVLSELLIDLVDKKTPLDYIINSDPDDYMNDDLYPNK